MDADRLADRVRAGDREATAELVRLYQDRVYRFAAAALGDDAAGEDVAQETFLRVVRGAHRWTPEKPFEAWLFTIAANLVTDERRRRAVRSRTVRMSEGRDDAPGGFEGLVAEREPGPLEQAEKRELYAAALAAARELPEEQRTVFFLREYGHVPFHEIATMTSAPLNTVLGRMHYALAGIRRALQAKVRT